MTGLDLSGIETWVNQDILIDDIRVQTDNLDEDAVLDEATGQLTVPPPLLVWRGKGAILPLTGFAQVQDPNVQRIVRETDARYRALIQADVVARFLPGQHVIVEAVHGTTPDPLITSRLFRIVELGPVSTFMPVRQLWLKQVGSIPEGFPAPTGPGAAPIDPGDLIEDPDYPGFYDIA